MTAYNFSKIENKWQGIWEKRKIFVLPESSTKPKYYCLVMFPYPSGKLHMGHVRNYVLGDVFSRFHRMLGHNVLHPIGWDAFGLPAENAAIKNKVDPEIWTKTNIKLMASQLKDLGISYNWAHEIATCDPEYYRWNQWFFIRMWKKRLAYKKKSNVNWCPSCKTVLANEQVNQGRCWRCDSEVQDRELEQWFLKITQYAEELLSGHKTLEHTWPQEVLLMQKNWIGKSTGAKVDFPIKSDDETFKSTLHIFTTRPDTLFGATFMVIAPEHKVIKDIKGRIKNIADVEKYVLTSRKKTNVERSFDKDITGIKLEGVYAVNPVNNSKIPIFVADYVLMEYGTGAIMAVPAHDQRDWKFAKKYQIPIVEVIHSPESDIKAKAFEGEGIMENSGTFNGIKSTDAVSKVCEWLEENAIGRKTIHYRLKDWLISRQRYWGTPIPMVYCENCGTVPVNEDDLPVLLPKNVQLTGVGESPLANVPEFVNTKCPECGGDARRETDTMDTFVDSSWYYARYCDPQNSLEPFSGKKANAWLPVNQYIGGIEHACMHLIYARFWHKVMRDLGLVDSDEPFERLLSQGMVTLGGSAMSKSKGNIVTQDEIVTRFGADTARLFILFAAPPQKQLEWSSDGIEGCWRFLNRIWRLIDLIASGTQKTDASNKDTARDNLLHLMHLTIRKVTNDIEKEQQLNTAIASIMELVNEIYACLGSCKKEDTQTVLENVILLLAPFTPHICEEMWERLGNSTNLVDVAWPVAEQKYLAENVLELPIQINGKLRSKISVSASISEADLKQKVESEMKLKGYLENKKIVKYIYIPKKIVNIIVSES